MLNFVLISHIRGGTKMEDAADLYTKSAHAYKMAKKYSCKLNHMLCIVSDSPYHG